MEHKQKLSHICLIKNVSMPTSLDCLPKTAATGNFPRAQPAT